MANLPKHFAQCSLEDFIPEISHRARSDSSISLDLNVAFLIIDHLRDRARCEAVLQRHPLVRTEQGLMCNGSVESKNAWIEMLNDLLSPIRDRLADAGIMRVYLIIKHLAQPSPDVYSLTAEQVARLVCKGRLLRWQSAMASSEIDGITVLQCCMKDIDEFLADVDGLRDDAGDRKLVRRAPPSLCYCNNLARYLKHWSL